MAAEASPDAPHSTFGFLLAGIAAGALAGRFSARCSARASRPGSACPLREELKQAVEASGERSAAAVSSR